MFKILFQGAEPLVCEVPLTIYDAARTAGLMTRDIICAECGGAAAELTQIIDCDAEIRLLTFEDEAGKKVFRHTASHILAQAVKRLFPEAKLGIGPAIDNGFYYDFDCETPFTPETLTKLEAEMKKLSRKISSWSDLSCRAAKR